MGSFDWPHSLTKQWLSINLSLKNITGASRIEPRAAGCKVRTLSIVLCRPPRFCIKLTETEEIKLAGSLNKSIYSCRDLNPRKTTVLMMRHRNTSYSDTSSSFMVSVILSKFKKWSILSIHSERGLITRRIPQALKWPFMEWRSMYGHQMSFFLGGVQFHRIR